MSNFISNAFMMPNDLIDKGYMAKMKGAALPCYLFIVRKTRGWNKSNDNISISQLVEGTGYKKDAVLGGVEQLISMGIVEKISFQNRPSKYTLTDNVIAVGNTASDYSAVGNTDTAVVISDSNLSEIPTHKNNIKTTNTKTKVISDSKAKFSFVEALKNLGANDQLIHDWLAVRKTKKASNNQTSFSRFESQLAKSNLDINTVLKICIERDWKGFDVTWLANINLAEYQEQTQQAMPEQPATQFKGVAKKFKGMDQ
ncbi:replication protein [Acinetobacter lactucae]|uniref:replication protein n=1 Tax=Acinetobacter lactucae TaxID=1785128 RepID=UPI0003DF8F1B|nr:replication protein [Acinetobacter lactucae]ETR94443.1 bacteriophage replication O family protein [Acinetobacter lactucae]